MTESTGTFRITDLISSKRPSPVIKPHINQKLFNYNNATQFFNTLMLQNYNHSFLEMITPNFGQSRSKLSDLEFF